MTSGYLVSWLSGCPNRAVASRFIAAAGQSVLGTSVTVAASRDLIVRDGIDQATITVTTRDSNGQPKGGVTLRMDVKVGGVLGDLGTLSARTITTLSDGHNSVTYTAPPPATFGAPNEATIQAVAS